MKKWQRIEDLRKDLDLTQEQMAKNLYTSETQYRRYENAKGNNFFEAMIQIAQFHKVSLDYIAGLTNDKGGLHKNSKEEQNILEMYKRLTEKNKGKAELLLSQLLKKQENKEKEQEQEQEKQAKKYENNISINQNNGKVNIKNK